MDWYISFNALKLDVDISKAVCGYLGFMLF
jgi:hypothetical protein